MKATISKWGNSLAFRIPKHIAESLQLQEGSSVSISVSDNCLTIAPLKRKKYTLEELLKDMTPEHFHLEISTGNAIGQEIL
ncbi:growth regulator [Synechococcus sp. PCC 7502]|uniref:AbrB/MazE/SpoVT family DNA-binding domain-containing protein n=1 Tax=Synechococcus sp. PCC 7502 TaxID=1173263 RepID=UPI00029FF334|nr:AbrB/MazE/SpoVT family DNA-binding domain-containing protein [Synechococcus sp. PCC 7502]AFY72606.1 growth regulator [Synechococcus sp. PCC 7502]